LGGKLYQMVSVAQVCPAQAEPARMWATLGSTQPTGPSWTQPNQTPDMEWSKR